MLRPRRRVVSFIVVLLYLRDHYFEIRRELETAVGLPPQILAIGDWPARWKSWSRWSGNNGAWYSRQEIPVFTFQRRHPSRCLFSL